MKLERRQNGDAVRTKQIEIVDDGGHVRGIFGLTTDSASEPQLVLRDMDGHDSLLLKLNHTGEGFLGFSSRDIEGTVIVGEIPGGDVIDASDSGGAWGVVVRSRDGSRSSLGFFKSGAPMGLSHSQLVTASKK